MTEQTVAHRGLQQSRTMLTDSEDMLCQGQPHDGCMDLISSTAAAWFDILTISQAYIQSFSS